MATPGGGGARSALQEIFALFRADNAGLIADVEKAKKVVADGAKRMEKDGSEGASRLAAKLAEGFAKGSDQAGDSLVALGNLAGRTVGSISGIASAFGPVGIAIAAFTVVVAAAADQVRRAVAAAIEFESAFARTQVILTLNGQSVNQYKAALTGLSSTLGTPTELIGTFHKALLDASDPQIALRMTELAAKFAAVSGSTPDVAVETLGSLMDSLGIKAENAGEIMDLLFFTMRKGGGDINQLSTALPRLTDIAGQLGIGLDEVSGALTTLGQIAGASPQKNLQAMDILFRSLIQNATRFQEQGIDLNALIKTKGLQGALEAIIQATGGSATKLREMGIEGRALALVLKATGDGAQVLADNIREAGQAAGETDRAFEVYDKTLPAQIKKLGVEWQKFQLIVGELIVPPIVGIITGINNAISNIKAGWEAFTSLLSKATPALSLVAKIAGLISPIPPSLFDAKDVDNAEMRAKALEKNADATKELSAAEKEARPGIGKATRAPIDLSGENVAQEKARLERERIDRQLGIDIETRAKDRLQAVIRFGADEAKLRTSASLDLLEIEKRAIQDTQQVEDEKVQIKRESLQKEIALLEARQTQDDETKAKTQNLKGELAKLEDDAVAKQAESNAKITQIVAQRAREVERIEKSLFDFRKNLGQVTINEELERLQETVNDTTKSETDRIAAAQQRAEVLKKTEQSLFDLKRSLGLTSLQEELARQQEIVNSTKVGTAQRIAEEQKLADKQKELREASKSAALGLLGVLQERLADRGVENVTADVLAQEAERYRMEQDNLLRNFQGGVATNIEGLKTAISSSGLFQQINQLGGSVQGIFGQAAEAATREIGRAGPRTPQQALSEALGQGPPGLEKEQAKFNEVADSVNMLGKTYSDVYNQILVETDTFVNKINEKLKIGSGTTATNIIRGISQAVIRELEEEALRR